MINLSFIPKVLVIDDCRWELEFFKFMLEDFCHVVKENSSAKAIKTAISLQPHIIVLDMIMPEVDGVKLLTQLKSHASTKHIPVIMATALSKNEDCIVNCIELGAVDYLFKPISSEILRVKISRAVQMQNVENSLRNSLAYNELLMDAIHSIIVGVGAEDKINFWNSASEEYFNIPKEKALGNNILDIGLSWDWPAISKNILPCMVDAKYSDRFEIECFKSECGPRTLLLKIAPVMGEADSQKGYLIIADDITEEKNKQAKERQMEKLQSIGQLAAGIAHEINTPIQYLGDNAHFLQESFQDLSRVITKGQSLINDLKSAQGIEPLKAAFESLYEESDMEFILDDVPKAIEQSLEGIDRVATIVKAMKDFSHPDSSEKEKVDINRMIESTITISRNVWKYHADLNTDLDPNLGEIDCFAGPINEVILNLIVNSAHAIEAANKNNQRAKGLINISSKHCRCYGEIRVEDNGPGIPKAIQEKVFDPFFTTKEVGKGTGQGLSICRNIIVKQHGGELFFESKQNQGTTFIIRLPISKPG